LYDSDSDGSTTKKKKKKKKKKSRGVWGIQQGTYCSARVVQMLSFVEAL
jgi:ribosomal protein L20